MRLKKLSAKDKFIFQPGDSAEKADVHMIVEVSGNTDSDTKVIDLSTGKETTRDFTMDSSVVLLNL